MSLLQRTGQPTPAPRPTRARGGGPANGADRHKRRPERMARSFGGRRAGRGSLRDPGARFIRSPLQGKTTARLPCSPTWPGPPRPLGKPACPFYTIVVWKLLSSMSSSLSKGRAGSGCPSSAPHRCLRGRSGRLTSEKRMQRTRLSAQAAPTRKCCGY